MKAQTDIKSLYRLFREIGLVDTDTRRIRPGSMFFALKGENFDGNRFAPEALEKGASWAVVDDDSLPPGPEFIRVDNALAALQQLAALHRRESGFRILAITGSNGKTTTKELCRAVLAGRYKVHATEGNLNNHIGLPLTLLSMDSTMESGIIEMGANHPGEIALLCEIAQPDYGLITNIGKAHLEGFGGLDGVARAKGELFTWLARHDGMLLVNEGDERIMQILPKGSGKVVYYNGETGLKALAAKSDPFLEVMAGMGEKRLDIRTQLIGTYNVENVLAACCVGLTLDVPEEDIVESIRAYRPAAYRSQFIRSSSNRIFMDAYNANPSSMMAALREFLAWKDENKLLILGEMREVGGESEAEHRHIISFLKQEGLTDVICTGKAFQTPALEAGYRYFDDAESLAAHLRSEPVRQRTVFVKGSRSNRLEQILEIL